MIEHDQFNCLGFCWAPSPRYIDLTLYFISSKDVKFTQIVFQSYQRTMNKAKIIQNVTQGAADVERSGSSTKGRTPTYAILLQNLVLSRFMRFLKGRHRAFYESHPALGVFSTKVSLLLKGFQQKSACFRRASGEPTFVELL